MNSAWSLKETGPKSRFIVMEKRDTTLALTRSSVSCDFSPVNSQELIPRDNPSRRIVAFKEYLEEC